MDGFDHMVPGLQATAYVSDRTHALLARDAHLETGPNIGRTGGNLTISCLSLNRAALSIKLLHSIRDQLTWFTGRVLIIDNGSDAAELATLRAACDGLPFATRIVELGRNFGVAGGRNRMMAHVETDWVMCLDNDIYLTGNPLPVIQRDLATLGCHFLNLPLLDRDGKTIFARGGHLYLSVDEAGIRIGAGSVFPQTAFNGTALPGFLSTFLFGGASVINKHTFAELGGYDEGMFIGFEDIDFSIRLFQAGLKIGNTGAVALVHDHPPPAGEDDRDYERQRFSRAVLKRSAEHLEAKYGMGIWSAVVDNWLSTRQRELGIGETPAPTPADPPSPGLPAAPRTKPRIALVVDVIGWAFWNISQQVCRHLGDRFEFTVIPTAVVDNVAHVMLMARGHDLIHVFWREYLGLFLAPHPRTYVDYLCGDYDRLLAEVKSKVISTAIYDHLYLSEAELAARRPFYNDFVDAYYVGSQRLRAIYEAVPDFRRPSAVLEDGVDCGLFHPVNLERFENVDRREVVLGWAGNSKWSAELEDFKGVHTILRPAVAELQAEGLPVRLELADFSVQKRPHSEMVRYYAGIDAYICTSKIEGTPNPVLESMACGVPIVTTDVGVVPQAFGALQSEFILRERSIECLKEAIRRLVRQPELFRRLSRENLESIKAWDWSLKTRGFGDYFERCLQLKAAGGS